MTQISIILVAYNNARTVRDSLESIIAQENADVPLECIVVDDCSTDDTLAIIRRTVGGYEGSIKFRIYRHQTCHGLSRARNTGLTRAEGEYVLFVRANDVLRPGCIDAYMVALMRHWGTDVIAGNSFHVKMRATLFEPQVSTMAIRGRGDVILHEMLHSHLYLYAWNKLIRRELLSQANVQFDDTEGYADVDWAFTLFNNVSSVVRLPQETYEHRCRDLVSMGMKEKFINSLLASYAATIDNRLNQSPRPESSDGGYYQSHQLFLYGMLTHAQRLMEEYNVNSQVKRELAHVRQRLLSQTKSDGQKILSLYFLQDGSILSSIIKRPIFKRYSEIVNEVVAHLDQLV